MNTTPLPIRFGKYYSYWMEKTPRRFLYHLAYYHFAANLIGAGKRVLDIGCNEGMGTRLLSAKCAYAKGIDLDPLAIEKAQKNWSNSSTHFECADMLHYPPGQWDAVTNFDVIEHILPENMETWWKSLSDQLVHDGMAIIGTPSLASQKFASAVTNKGHVNLYSAERLEAEMKEYFHFVFLFSANDEVIHTGFFPLAHYYLAVGCQKFLGAS